MSSQWANRDAGFGGVGAETQAKLSRFGCKPMMKKRHGLLGTWSEALNAPKDRVSVIGDTWSSSKLLYVLRCVSGPAVCCIYTWPFPEVCLQTGA